MNDSGGRRGAPYDFNFSGGWDPADIDRSRAVSMLAYLGILFFLPLVVYPDSKYGRYHANQGLVLFLFWTVGSLICRHIPLLGGFFGWIYGALMVIMLIIGMVNAYNGRAIPLPVIGRIRIIR